MTPGIHDISMAEYLADPCPSPSLSAGLAHTLLTRSPLHAWQKRQAEQFYSRGTALGTVFHALFLGKGGEYQILEVDDFRTKAAREARDEALANGRTPIKQADFDVAHAMLEAAVRQLEAHEIGNVGDRPGKAEQAIIWKEPNGIWCRAMADWMLEPLDAIYDIKTTTCAHPDVWIRRAYQMGYDMTAAHYRRGVSQVLGVEVAYRFIVIENEPPHALSVIELSPAALDMAERRRRAAVNLWHQCLQRNSWPAYPSRICTCDPPGYVEAAQTEDELSGRYDPEMLDTLLEGFAA